MPTPHARAHKALRDYFGLDAEHIDLTRVVDLVLEAAKEEPNDGWHEAGRNAYWCFEHLSEATTLPRQAGAYDALYNAMANLVTWLPGWDWEHGVLHDPDNLYCCEECNPS